MKSLLIIYIYIYIYSHSECYTASNIASLEDVIILFFCEYHILIYYNHIL